MPTKRAPRPKRSTAPAAAAPTITRRTALVLLVAGLALSAYNLSLMTTKSGTLAGLTDSWTTLQQNYASSQSSSIPTMMPEEDGGSAPVVLVSVVKWRDGEEDAVREDLLAPLLAYYDAVEGSPLTAVLLERRNASSRDVNVRLFFADGSEVSYLWPRTNAKDGVWVPPEPEETEATGLE